MYDTCMTHIQIPHFVLKREHILRFCFGADLKGRKGGVIIMGIKWRGSFFSTSSPSMIHDHSFHSRTLKTRNYVSRKELRNSANSKDVVRLYQPCIYQKTNMATSNENNSYPAEAAIEQGEHPTVANNDSTTKTSEDTVQEVDDEEKQPDSKCKRFLNALWNFYSNNDFIVQVVIAILLARAYPPLGADYLQPHITATWICVVFIFVLAGLGLKTEEFKKAFQRFYFNVAVQAFNFGVVSSIVFGLSRALVLVDAIPQSLADGMVVCASLPLTINMCLVLTKSAGGDEASAIFNAAFGNMVGVFLSPVLILGYLGVTGDVDLFSVFYKLALRVVLPVTFGQALQKFSPTVVSFVKEHKKRFKKAQQLALVFIVYTVFCSTFSKEDDNVKVADIFIMIAIQFCLLCLVMGLAWMFLKILFPNEPTLRVMGLFGCTHKTVAMGVPLINAIYEDDPNVGLYTLPLLIWHPMQLVLGSFLAPKLSKWVETEKTRLGIEDDDDDEEDGDNEVGLKEQEETAKSEAPVTVKGEERESKVEDDCEESFKC